VQERAEWQIGEMDEVEWQECVQQALECALESREEWLRERQVYQALLEAVEYPVHHQSHCPLQVDLECQVQ
jgi:hypothetical protein